MGDRVASPLRAPTAAAYVSDRLVGGVMSAPDGREDGNSRGQKVTILSAQMVQSVSSSRLERRAPWTRRLSSIARASMQVPQRPTSAPRRITGAELRARRQVLGMTQEQLAEQLDTTKNTIARWERDEVRIEHGGMVRLALDALHNRTPSTITLPQLPRKRFASVPDSLVVMRADTVDLRANAIARTVVRNSATGAKFGGAPRSSRRSSKKR